MADKPKSPRKAPPPVRKSPALKQPKLRPAKIEAQAVAAPTRAATSAVSHPGMRLTAWVAAVVILLDQVLKYVVVHVMELDRIREIDVFPPWLNLRMAWNQGVNFGLFSSDQNVMRWVLIAVALGVCLWVWLWLRRGRPGMLGRIGAGLLIGGALGNVIDRLVYGAVADFLNMSLPGWSNPYSFNVADIAIFAGALGLVFMPSDTAKTQVADNTRDGTDNKG